MKKKRSSKAVVYFWRIAFIGCAFLLLFILFANWGLFGKMPSIEELENPSASLASEVIAEDGTLMGKYYLEDRTNVEFKDINKNVVNALVATEDERFYEHSGIDAYGLARAFAKLGRDGGASTITQQLAKNLFTDYSRNPITRIIQKVKESIIAIKLERNFTKNEIITLYLNTVPFSDNVYGIRNAAKTFFQKEPDRLNVEEAAVMIGMVNAPTLYNPRRNPKLALDRRNIVLDQMKRNKFLSENEATSLKRKTIVLNYKKLDETAGLAPYFRMVLGEEMKKWCKTHTKPNGDKYDLYRDGLKIYTTVNPRMQLYAEEAVGKHMNYMQKILNAQSNIRNGSIWKGHENILEAAMKVSERWKNLKRDGMEDEEIKKTFYKKTPMRIFAWNNKRETDTTMTPYDSIKYHRQMLQAGFMVMDPLSGQIKAWVGGIDFKTFKFDHVNINTKRQVGSTIKPLLYGLAIEEAGLNPNSIVQDVQQNFGSLGLVPATSTTCTGRSMTMTQALTWSRNCATAYIMKQLGTSGNEGPKRFVDFLKRSNLQTKIEPYPSIALGSSEISLYEMMQAYSMFPGRGFNAKPMLIARIEDKNGNVIENMLPTQRKEVINEVTAYSVALMMQSVIKNGTGRSMAGYGLDGEIAGKTGTTNDNSDAWFIGYTPQLLAGAWVGGDDRFIRLNSTDEGQGSRAALPIWAYFFSKAFKDPTLGLERNAKFVAPESMSNDVIYDYMNSPNTVAPGAQGEDIGNGSSDDYSIPLDIEPEEIKAESDLPKEKVKPGVPTVEDKPVKKPEAENPTTEPKEKKGFLRGIFGKKDKKNKDTAKAETPKAVLPKKPNK